MRRTTRRDFLLAAGAIPVLARSAAAARPRSDPPGLSSTVSVQRVSAFSGPFIVDRLKAGRPLQVSWERGKAFVRLDGYALGWLPDPASRAWRQSSLGGRPFEVCVEGVARDGQGRLLLFVEVLSRG